MIEVRTVYNVKTTKNLLNFQVNAFVGLFWTMLKISTWLVVFFAPPQILFTQSTSSLSVKIVHTACCI